MNKSLKIIRQSRGFSQENIAHELEISQKTYSDIENGKTCLKPDKIVKLAKILQVEISEICPIDCSSKNNKLEKILQYLNDNQIKIPKHLF